MANTKDIALENFIEDVKSYENFELWRRNESKGILINTIFSTPSIENKVQVEGNRLLF